MKLHKSALFLAGLLCSNLAVTAPSNDIPFPTSTALENTVGTFGWVARLVGYFQVTRGVIQFFKNSDGSITAKPLSDYNTRELSSMKEEKLQRLIAQEDARREQTLESLQTFLTGVLWLSLGRIGYTYSTGSWREFQAKHVKG